MTIFNHLAYGFIGLAAAASIAVAPLAIAHENNGKQGNDNSQHKTQEVKKTNVMADINAAGKVIVRGATVTAVSGSVLSATTVWGGATLTWTVLATSSVHFIDKNGESEHGVVTVADIKVGDVINFQGSLAGGTGLTVNARIVRDATR